MDHVELLNDIINAGYVSPVLVDQAEKEHARYIKIAQTLIDAIASMGNKLTIKWEKNSYSGGRRGELVSSARSFLSQLMTGDKPNQTINIKCTINGVTAVLSYTTLGKIDLTSSLSTLDSLEGVSNPEACFAILKAQTADMDFVAHKVEFDGYIETHFTALTLKEALLADVKASFNGGGLRRGVFDMNAKDMTRQHQAELASLFFSGVKKIKFNKYALEDKVVATDFGLKDVDDLAAVIYIAYSLVWEGSDCRLVRNAELVPFHQHLVKRVDEAVAYGRVLAVKNYDGTVNLRETFRNKANLIAFIEFLGGRVPHKVCWR